MIIDPFKWLSFDLRIVEVLGSNVGLQILNVSVWGGKGQGEEGDKGDQELHVAGLLAVRGLHDEWYSVVARSHFI